MEPSKSKVIQIGSGTVIIQRPDLDDQERAKREQEVKETLEHALREYIARKERSE